MDDLIKWAKLEPSPCPIYLLIDEYDSFANTIMIGVQNEKMNGKPPDKQRDKILDSIADGVFTVDRENNITFFNRAAEKLWNDKLVRAAFQPRKVAAGRRSHRTCSRAWP